LDRFLSVDLCAGLVSSIIPKIFVGVLLEGKSLMQFVLKPSFLVFTLIMGLFVIAWGSQSVWASPGQSPNRQTVPTREKTNAPTLTPVVPTAVPSTNTPVVAAPTQPGVIVKTAQPVAPSSTSTTAPLPVQTPTALVLNATGKDNVRIRALPSTNATITGQLRKGETAVVVGRTTANDWLEIIIPSDTSKRGWISADYATLNLPVETVPVVSSETSNGQMPAPSATLSPVLVQPTPLVTETAIPIVLYKPTPTISVAASSLNSSAAGGSMVNWGTTVLMGGILIVVGMIVAGIAVVAIFIFTRRS
jgi:hypothetical protein